jgi:hypothetical protein
MSFATILTQCGANCTTATITTCAKAVSSSQLKYSEDEKVLGCN